MGGRSCSLLLVVAGLAGGVAGLAGGCTQPAMVAGPAPSNRSAPPAGLDAPPGARTGPARDEGLWIPMTDARGDTHRLETRVCRPPGDGPARVVVVAHGSPPDAAARPRMPLPSCESENARWFLSRGFLVAFTLRRGYGATGGAWAEAYGSCNDSDFFAAGLETARDLDATVTFVTSLPGARRDGAVIVGHSAGGWGAVAYDSQPHPRVATIVAMAPGRGGHQHGQPNDNCRPERLAEAMARYGRTATTPILLVYAANDTFFEPSLVQSMQRAFVGAGGHDRIHQIGDFQQEGHYLFTSRGGSSVWGPLVESYLAEQVGAEPPERGIP